MPEIFEKLAIIRFYGGGLTYSDLTDRPESSELYEVSSTFMLGWNEAEKIIAARNQPRSKAGIF